MKLQTGDHIRVLRRNQYTEYYHHGTYIGFRGPNGESIIENTKGVGIRLVTLAEFSQGGQIEVVARTAKTWAEREAIVRRAWTDLGQPYNLLSFNCEHAANKAQFGVPVSPQVQRAVVAAVFIGAGLFFVWNQ